MSLSISSVVSAADSRAVSIYEQSAAHSSFGTAQNIIQDYTLYGRITNSSQLDYYSVTFTDAGKANFWLGDIPTGCNYNIYIYDSSYTLVASSVSTASQELVANHPVAANSTYYILVRSSSGYDTANYYRLRAKWYPTGGFTYFYNKNPEAAVGTFSIDNVANLTTRSGFNVVDEIKASGCFVTSYAMILANLGKTTATACYDPRTGETEVLEADPFSVTLANMGFPTMYSTNVLNDNGLTPVRIRNYDNIATRFNADFTQYDLSQMEDGEKIVAITYYLALHPEGIVIRFNNNGSKHALVVTGSGYVATQSEVATMLGKVSVTASYDYPGETMADNGIALCYNTTDGYINDSNGGNYFTVYDPAYYGASTDGSLTLSGSWTAQVFTWAQLEYIEVFD